MTEQNILQRLSNVIVQKLPHFLSNDREQNPLLRPTAMQTAKALADFIEPKGVSSCLPKIDVIPRTHMLLIMDPYILFRKVLASNNSFCSV